MADVCRSMLRNIRTGFVDPEWVSISMNKVAFVATTLRK
jgi:hypothetical protein